MLLISREKPETLADLAEISGHHIHELSRKIDALSSKGFIQFEGKGMLADLSLYLLTLRLFSAKN
ncbi:transcriptional regulator [Vibrio sp. MEBiC08052]|nr:transcriptional regulator [Vibrio sp. MEBiC08052]